jgi:hypothetical protein
MYRAQIEAHGYGAAEAWKPIASLLLACGVWRSKTEGWSVSNEAVFFKEANEFRPGSATTRRGARLGDFLAAELGFDRDELCSHIGLYWADERFRLAQPHNLVGHAFRSMLVEALTLFGDPDICYEEEADPLLEFPGNAFATRSRRARIDIAARRGNTTVALISSRWRFRHDRVEVVEEALAYMTAAIRTNPRCKQYAWVGEFSPARLEKILDHTAPNHPHPPLAACVHFEPRLLTEGLGERAVNGQLQSLAWLISETAVWR